MGEIDRKWGMWPGVRNMCNQRITKQCVTCKGVFDSSMFGKNHMTADGLTNKCKRCRNTSTKTYEWRKNCYLYLMQAENGLIKIGIADDVDARLDQIRRQSPINVNLLDYAFIELAGKAESFLHVKYGEYRHHYEWFAIPQNQIEGLLIDFRTCATSE